MPSGSSKKFVKARQWVGLFQLFLCREAFFAESRLKRQYVCSDNCLITMPCFSEVSGDRVWCAGCRINLFALQQVEVRLDHVKLQADGFRFCPQGHGEKFGLVKNGDAVDAFVI